MQDIIMILQNSVLGLLTPRNKRREKWNTITILLNKFINPVKWTSIGFKQSGKLKGKIKYSFRNFITENKHQIFFQKFHYWKQAKDLILQQHDKLNLLLSCEYEILWFLQKSVNPKAITYTKNRIGRHNDWTMVKQLEWPLPNCWRMFISNRHKL